MASRRGTYSAVLGEHRRRLSRLAERRGVDRVKGLYDDAVAVTEKRLGNLVRAQRGEVFSAHTSRLVLAQLREGQKMVAARMAGETGDISREAQVESVRGIAGDLTRLQKAFTGADIVVPIDEAARLRELVAGRRDELDAMHAKAFSRWGARTFDAAQTSLSTSLASGANTADAIEGVLDVTAGEWWQAERIVRTETAWAFSASSADAIEEASKELPDLMMRWCEHVDDETGEKMDDRVGVDSLAMHGQVVAPGDQFVMPPEAPNGEEVSESLVGESWAFPPNRPNDRSVLSPWMRRWGIPGWMWRGGERVQLA